MLAQTWIYTIIAVLVVSLVSLIGIITLSFKTKNLQKFLMFLISLSAGTLLGDAFFHLLPEITEESGLTFAISAYILLGITIFFILEKIVHWQHCHSHVLDESHIHPLAHMNLLGDALHNFLDGIIIAASFLVSIPAGIATTIAVLLHEIPQEIGDFGVLIHGGFSKAKALFVNFISALTALLGAILTLIIKNSIEPIEIILIPIAIGGFIYIASADLIPELHKHSDKLSRSLLQLLAFVTGIILMALLLQIG